MVGDGLFLVGEEIGDGEGLLANVMQVGEGRGEDVGDSSNLGDEKDLRTIGRPSIKAK